MSMPVFVFAAALGVASTFLAGLMPALRLSNTAGLTDRSRAGSAGHTRARKFFIAAQLALSLVLLTVAGLYGRSLSRLLNFKPGFEARELASFAINPGTAGYDPARAAPLLRELRSRLRALPGVTSVSLADAGPLSHSSSGTNVEVEGYRHGPEENMDVLIIAAGPSYMRTMGTKIIAGRDLDDRDTMDAPKAAVVNQAFVRRFMKNGENIVGRHMSQGSGGPLDIEIVGVAEDVKHLDLREKTDPAFFLSYEQAMKGSPRAPRASFYVRSTNSVTESFRPLVGQLDPNLPVTNIQTMQKTVEEAITTDRLVSRLSSAFGLLALIITAVGLYGVLSYLTQRRTGEFGIRMALGATRGNIVGLVTREVVILLAAGAAAGLAGAYAATRAIESQLFGHTGIDAVVLSGSVAVLALVAVLAAALPSAKAAGVQPSIAHRHE
jgi:predicted permease